MEQINGPMAAITTIKSSSFEMICARIFGKTIIARDETLMATVTIKAKLWRGKYYMISHDFSKRK